MPVRGHSLRRLIAMTFVLTLLPACAGKPVAVGKSKPQEPETIVAQVPMPAGAHPAMKIPARLPGGGFVTPNRNLTSAATIWHVRVALNVAALACRGPLQGRIVAGYNQLLTDEKDALALVEKEYSAEYQADGGDWRSRYDNAMTRLYNFFSQSPERTAFCEVAASVVEDSAGIDPDFLPTFAEVMLPRLERPFTDFYTAFAAWRDAHPDQANGRALQMNATPSS